MRLVSTIIILLAVSIQSLIAQVKYEADTIKSSKEYQSDFSKNRISISQGIGFSYNFIGSRFQYRRSGKLDLGAELITGFYPVLDPNVDGIITLGFGLKWYFLKDFYLNANYGNLSNDFNGRNWTRGLTIGTDFLKYTEKTAYGMNVGLGWGQIFLNEDGWFHIPYFDLGFVLLFGV